MDSFFDVIIIGGGVTGCAVARELSRYRVSVALLEKASDVAEGASKANSGIVHAGYDAMPGTQKAYYNVRGSLMYPGLCETLSVPYKQIGALVIGFSAEDRTTLEALLARGIENGVDGMSIIEHDDVLRIEPSVNPDVQCALYVPSSGIVSPYELTFALADDAAANGVHFMLNTEVISVRKGDSGFFGVRTDKGEMNCRILVNCAGCSSAELHNMLSDRKQEIIFRRGQYYLLDRNEHQPFMHTVFQCPSVWGKGVLISPTVHNNLLIGPSAEDISDASDTSTTQDGLDSVITKARLTWPGLSLRSNITNFSGIRAHEINGDFSVGAVSGCPGAYEASGIESPGLSSAPAIGVSLATEIAADYALERKTDLIPYQPPVKPFRDMTPEEQYEAVKADPSYGNIVCRCEVVTEAEIIAAIHRPVGAATIDAVKRRTRSGMGRCQGGFCSPRVAGLIAKECGIPLAEVTKNGGKSYILTGEIG